MSSFNYMHASEIAAMLGFKIHTRGALFAAQTFQHPKQPQPQQQGSSICPEPRAGTFRLESRKKSCHIQPFALGPRPPSSSSSSTATSTLSFSQFHPPRPRIMPTSSVTCPAHPSGGTCRGSATWSGHPLADSCHHEGFCPFDSRRRRRRRRRHNHRLHIPLLLRTHRHGRHLRILHDRRRRRRRRRIACCFPCFGSRRTWISVLETLPAQPAP